MMAREKEDRQKEHQDRSDDPVLNKRKGQDLKILEYLPKFFIPHLGKGRIHHQYEADGNGDIGGSHLETVYYIPNAGIKISASHADEHGQENPQSQKSIQK